MKRRIACLLLAVLLLFSLPPAAVSSPGIIFTMINGNAPEPLLIQTMPVLINGNMHVPLSVLEQFGVSFSLLPENETSFRLAQGADVYIEFDLYDQSNITHQGATLAVTPISRHGTLFFPVSHTPTMPGPLAFFFDVNYQFLQISPAPVLRLYHDLGGVSHETLALEGEQLFNLTERLNTFTGSPIGGTGPTGGGTVVTPSPPPPPPPPPSPPPQEENEGESGSESIDLDSLPVHQVYLSFIGLTDETEALLDRLSRARIPAGFFVTAEDVEAFPDLVRRIHGEGHQLGIYLTGDVEREFTAASRSLFDAARLRTVLVIAQTEDAALRADALGLIVYEAPVPHEFDNAERVGRLSGDLLVDSSSATAYALTALTDLLRSNAYRALRIVDSIFAV